jgi:hypothetical protein
MKNITIFILSELFAFVLGFGIIVILFPGISMLAALSVTISIYIFTKTVSFLSSRLIKFGADKYYDWKGGTK